MQRSVYSRFIKRALDVVLSLLALVVLSPLLIITGIVLFISHRGKNPLFVQERIGRKGKFFKIYKFRTMNDKRDIDGNLLPDHRRMTAFGKIIRTCSIDELPQLWNVLRGDMAIVGPRPVVTEYLPLFTPAQMRRHDVLPGITGWAQCHGRNNISWSKKFEMDVWYIDNLSFLIDFKIILSTIRIVLSRRGINTPGYATVEKFNGHN